MNQTNVGLFDLPNEILLIILKKLDNMDVLYSLLDVDNQRLDILAQENTFTNTLNFVLTTLTNDIFTLTPTIINRFCTYILPRIHHNVKSLILDSVSMERILLAADYPNLTELKLFNFNGKIVSYCFTDASPYGRIFQRQITDLILVFEKYFNDISGKNYTTDVYEYILKSFENLKHLSIIGSYIQDIPPLVLCNLPLTTFFSSTLNKLCIRVGSFEDCLALLDGRLKKLTTLIVVINDMEYDSSNVYNTDDLPNLKCFSLTTSFCLTDIYDAQIPRLFRRMSNLEELTLYITIEDRTTFIDGTDIYNEILVHMPRLHLFNFCICTDTKKDLLAHHLSKDDIQQTLSNIKYQQMDCIVNYRYSTAICYVFSLPFMFEILRFIGNTFPTIVFSHVRSLSVKDDVPFKDEFFCRIAWSFPLLEKLCVINIIPQSSISDKQTSNDNQLHSIVKYPYLISLRLLNVHIDYVEQFLNETKTHLPRLTKLTVNYSQLKIVTKKFKRDTTRLNCIQIQELYINETIIQHKKNFYVYFPLFSISSNIRQYRYIESQTPHSPSSHYIINLHSWKLTHQPREPTLHWSSRFRQQQQQQFETEEQEENQSSENWDSWFQQHQSSLLLPFSQHQLYFLDHSRLTSMPKRPRESSSPIHISNKREKYSLFETNLPKRTWINTNYEERLIRSRYYHFNFHIMSYNILAQRLIEDNPSLYDNCLESNLEWHRRKERLLREILKQDADIICLQEMQKDHYKHDFRPKMVDHGYNSIYIKRSGDKSDGCCLFYKTDRLKLIASKTVPFYQKNIQLLDRDNCGLIALFQPITPNATSDDLFCVATTHLLFSPKRGDIKLAQIQYFLAEIDQLSVKDSTLNSYYPIIVCGDFNAQPQSPLSKFLINGHIKYDTYRCIEISGQIPESIVNNRFSFQLPSNELLPSSFVTSDCRFPKEISSNKKDQLIFQTYMNRTSSAILTHNKKFNSVYDLNDLSEVTTCIGNESNLVDYIFYTKKDNDRHRLNLLSRYDLYQQNQLLNLHLPNHQFASDHFLLAAKFALKLKKKKK
ncbi:unnamed protein product [Rotaria sordida]|uniref:F-box domain-containing protein n=1 Tax=Rotaria sordida TaxID=392033 RepID=A0A814X989_9BILA|nr:unnamed protein product [Rotaria sordida]CAF1489221.1 unnamed protein product [Rotaria sordida]